MEEILKQIEDAFREFMKNAKVTGNKAAAMRARTHSTELRSLLKGFRAKSLAALGQ